MKKYFLSLIVILALGACKKSSNDPLPIKGQDIPPDISYPSTISLSVGKPADISPKNRGGEVPATLYGQVTTFAGSPDLAKGYVNGNGLAALFNAPQQLVRDKQGNLYIADSFNNAIRKISPDGTVSTFAGSLTGINGNKDAADNSALFDSPDGIAIDATGNFFVSDYNNNAIRKITPAGVVSTFYKATTVFGPGGICFDNSGNLIVTGQDANQVVKISPAGVSTLIAGSADKTGGYVNGNGTSAVLYYPTDVKTDAAGNIYVVEYMNSDIRKITPDGMVTTFSGTLEGTDGQQNPYLYRYPSGIAIGAGGVMYVADMGAAQVQRIMPNGTVSLVAGSLTGLSGSTDGVGSGARFYEPIYICIDDAGAAYVTDLVNQNVRKIVLTGYSYQGDKLPVGLTFDYKTGLISGTPTTASAAINCTVTGFNISGFSSSTFSITVR
ncbi:MAG TPA: putative Ig domain-containing protein [Mucilaginibacter sp.]|nr:putative Ig domain-containing protein [Mucilaginibacter sp.]